MAGIAIITEACIDIKDRACVDVCPVQCIYEYDVYGNLLISEAEAGSGVIENSHRPNPDAVHRGHRQGPLNPEPIGGIMSYISTDDDTQIFYKDGGLGQPVLFSHGWLLSSGSWDNQMLFLATNGYRCIARDRRGHDRSTRTWDGNEMDTIAGSRTCTYVSIQPREA